jgi:hypothetical protein
MRAPVENHTRVERAEVRGHLRVLEIVNRLTASAILLFCVSRRPTPAILVAALLRRAYRCLRLRVDLQLKPHLLALALLTPTLNSERIHQYSSIQPSRQ